MEILYTCQQTEMTSKSLQNQNLNMSKKKPKDLGLPQTRASTTKDAAKNSQASLPPSAGGSESSCNGDYALGRSSNEGRLWRDDDILKLLGISSDWCILGLCRSCCGKVVSSTWDIVCVSMTCKVTFWYSTEEKKKMSGNQSIYQWSVSLRRRGQQSKSGLSANALLRYVPQDATYEYQNQNNNGLSKATLRSVSKRREWRFLFPCHG